MDVCVPSVFVTIVLVLMCMLLFRSALASILFSRCGIRSSVLVDSVLVHLSAFSGLGLFVFHRSTFFSLLVFLVLVFVWSLMLVSVSTRSFFLVSVFICLFFSFFFSQFVAMVLLPLSYLDWFVFAASFVACWLLLAASFCSFLLGLDWLRRFSHVLVSVSSF